MEAVSYTHLDVYKRQEYERPDEDYQTTYRVETFHILMITI